MAHITYFKIDGLLGRENPIEAYLNRDVNIFFGENGCGKTTLLKVLSAGMSLDSDAMLKLPVERAEIDIYSINERKIIKHIWDRKSVRANSSIDANLLIQLNALDISEREKLAILGAQQVKGGWKSIGVKKVKAKEFIGYNHTFLPANRLYSADVLRRSQKGGGYSEHQLDEAFAENVNRTWLVYYTKILSQVRVIQEEGLRTVLYHGLSESKDDSVGPHIEPFMAYERVGKFLKRHSGQESSPLGAFDVFSNRYRSEPNLRKIVDSLNQVEERIESAMTPIDNFTATINKLFSRGKTVGYVEKGLNIKLENGEIISPANLSSGEKHLLTVLLAGMVGRSNSVIIDEPELSMHIDWQRSLVRTIHALNPECQLILASHSPEIMADIPDESIFKV
ncbi:MAG: AAA family ATPase [Ralstonia sp.]|uniref:AAA family ATPase n=1 Tax=Ralstonia sp. TaxID=54061 RepID=UPI003F7EB5F0